MVCAHQFTLVQPFSLPEIRVKNIRIHTSVFEYQISIIVNTRIPIFSSNTLYSKTVFKYQFSSIRNKVFEYFFIIFEYLFSNTKIFNTFHEYFVFILNNFVSVKISLSCPNLSRDWQRVYGVFVYCAKSSVPC
jgi:hypothetical protein